MTSLTDIIASLRDILIDWNGDQLPDGAEPRSPPTCGDIAAVLDALEKAEAEVARMKSERLYVIGFNDGADFKADGVTRW